jgi:hypothetical protein
MKYLTLILLAILCGGIYSCKKKETINPVPTSDYRSKYTGDFRLYCTSISITHPSDTSGKRDSTVVYSTVDATVSFSTTDSIKILSPVDNRTYPALTFTYSSGEKWQMGIEPDGRLVGNPYSSGGRFIGMDSVVYSSNVSHISTTGIYMMQGKRK